MSRFVRYFKRHPELILIPVFCIIYTFSLTFLYVEGDDAYSIMYHALGRNPQIERSYGPYQAMMDIWLSVLPASEPIVRVAGIGLHAVFGIVFPIVIIGLMRSYNLVNTTSIKSLVFFCVLLPFAFPELIFFGLYYQCSSIALSLVLIAHLILRNSSQYSGGKRIVYTTAAVILFSIGTCIRWDVGFYLIVVLVDLLLLETNVLKKKARILPSIGTNALIGLLCVAGVFFFIYLEGYSLSDILKAATYSQHGRKDVIAEISWKANIGSSLSLFTPFFILTFVLGLIIVIRQKKYILLLLLVLSYLYILKFYESEFLNPRRIINSIPFLVMICFAGFQYLYENRNRWKFIMPVVVTICFLPWIVGIKIYSNGTMWGPGFELKGYSEPNKVDINQLDKVDERVNIGQVEFTFFQGGFAVPYEGPRPLWGYFGVIFGGEWRRLLTLLNDERDRLLTKSIEDNLPIVQQDYGVNAMINLVRIGYTTDDKLTGIRIDENLSVRRFYKDGDTVTFIFPDNNAHLSVVDPAYIQHCGRIVGEDSLYLYIYSTSILRSMKALSDSHITTYGPTTGLAVLNNGYGQVLK